jgi:purine-binding chemotaxis protein CheW
VTGLRALLLPIGDDLYAVPIGTVREVVTAPTVTALPTAPRGVLGVFNLRGSVLPILDSGLLLGREALGGASCAVVVDGGAGDAALVTSGVPVVVDLDRPVQPSRTPGTVGTYQVGDRLAPLIDPVALLRQADLGAPQPPATER